MGPAPAWEVADSAASHLPSTPLRNERGGEAAPDLAAFRLLAILVRLTLALGNPMIDSRIFGAKGVPRPLSVGDALFTFQNRGHVRPMPRQYQQRSQQLSARGCEG